MRGSKYYIVLVTSLVFLIGLTTAIIPVKAPIEPTVKVSVNQPLGYIPFVAPGTKFTFDIIIETHGITESWGGTPATGIIGWGIDIQVDPNVLNIDLTVPPPPPFPPQAPAKVIGAQTTYVMWEYANIMGQTDGLVSGVSYPATGFWDDIAETIFPTNLGGVGDAMTAYYPKLVTIQMQSKSDTQPCLIDLIDVEYVLADGSVHPVDVVEDGYYGTPPTFMSETADPFDPTDPIGSMWHELYPNYCRMYELTDWTDNADGTLSSSDQITMVNASGWTYQYHVDKVTTTIHFSYKEGPTGPPTGDLGDAEPVEPNLLSEEIGDPIGTVWHMIYPDYCKEFVITSWEDNGNGVFDVSDQFDFEFFGEGELKWAHLDSVTTDIILSQKGEPEEPTPEFPLGLEIMMMLAAAIPIVYIWRTRKWSGKK